LGSLDEEAFLGLNFFCGDGAFGGCADLDFADEGPDFFVEIVGGKAAGTFWEGCVGVEFDDGD